MTHETDLAGLVYCLSQVPPVELEAVRLLQEARLTTSGGWFPTIPPAEIARATQELIAYTQSCAALLDKLCYLAPVILPTLDIPEWPL